MEINKSIGSRLLEVRESMGKTQSDFAAIAVAAEVPGATRQSQAKYEKGITTPSATYLAAIAAAGADVLYIVTGSRDGPAPERLSDDERAMLADYREASGALRRAARAALQSGTAQPGTTFSHITQNASTPGAVQVVGSGNKVLSRTRK